MIGCTPNYNKLFEENIKEFELQKEKFDNLISYIQTSNFKLNQEIPVDDFKSDFKKIANGLGIKSVEINNYSDCQENSICFNICKGWNIKTLNKVQFAFDPCSGLTKKGNHKNERHLDFWGLGDKWLMFSDTDFM